MITRGAVFVMLAILTVVGVVLAFDASIDRQVISSGGGVTENGLFSVHATIGQPVAGVVNIPLAEVQAGFWNGSIPEYEIFLPSIVK